MILQCNRQAIEILSPSARKKVPARYFGHPQNKTVKTPTTGDLKAKATALSMKKIPKTLDLPSDA